MKTSQFIHFARCFVLLFLLAISCVISQPLRAEDTTKKEKGDPIVRDVLANPTVMMNPQWNKVRNANGIVVGMPKVYSERFLRVTLEQLRQSLRSISFIDPEVVKRAAGVLQGTEAYRHSFGLTLAPAIPSITLKETDTVNETLNASDTTTETVTTGGEKAGTVFEHVIKSGGGNENKQETIKTTTTPSPVKATIPDYTQTALPSSNFGLGAHDVLATQMEMTYQILNLQMLLDRAISDRLVLGGVETESSYSPKTLDIVILGFQVSIDSRHENAVAQVEIAIEPIAQPQNAPVPAASATPNISYGSTSSPREKENGTPPSQPTGESKQEDSITHLPSLVAMFPQEKTYNMAMLTDDVSQFDVSTLVAPLSLGFGSKSSDSTVYLMRDVDTVAFQMLPSSLKGSKDRNVLRFGWQFRPVFGKKTVSPGIRQVYAVIAMPKSFVSNEPGFRNSEQVASYSFNVTAKTIWKRFDRKTKRIGSVLYGTESIIGYEQVRWIPDADMNKYLAPTVRAVDCIDLGDGTIHVDVDGENFYQGTQLMVGNKLYPPGASFQNLDENRLSFRIAASDLIQHQPLIVSEFGEKTPVQSEEKPTTEGDAEQKGKEAIPIIDPELCRLKEVGIDQTEVILAFKNKNDQQPVFNLGLPQVSVDDTPVTLFETADKKGDGIFYRFGHIGIPLPGNLFVIVAGNQLYGLNNMPVTTYRNRDKTRLFVKFIASTSALMKNPSITLKSLLGPDKLTSSWCKTDQFSQFFTIDKPAVLFKKTDTTVEFGLFGSNLNENIKLYIGGSEYPPDPEVTQNPPDPAARKNRNFLKFTIPIDKLKTAKTILALGKDQMPVPLELKFDLDEKKPAPRPAIHDIMPVGQGDVMSIPLTGMNLSSIKRVLWKDEELKFWKETFKDQNGNNITNYYVELMEKVTEKPGMRELVFELIDGETVRKAFYVKPLKEPEK